MKIVFQMGYREYQAGDEFPAEKISETSIRFHNGRSCDFLNFTHRQALDTEGNLIAILRG